MTVKEAFEKILVLFEEAGVDSPAFEISIMLEDLLSLPVLPKLFARERNFPSPRKKRFFPQQKNAPKAILFST